MTQAMEKQLENGNGNTEWIGVVDAAKRFGLAPSYVYLLARNGVIGRMRDAKTDRLRVSTADIENRSDGRSRNGRRPKNGNGLSVPPAAADSRIKLEAALGAFFAEHNGVQSILATHDGKLIITRVSADEATWQASVKA